MLQADRAIGLHRCNQLTATVEIISKRRVDRNETPLGLMYRLKTVALSSQTELTCYFSGRPQIQQLFILADLITTNLLCP